jgi:S-(hydroxymethyl)glutathione dehydrogenase / alcohol dehydrogenase
MALKFRAAVLHEPQTPLRVETITTGALKPGDVLVRMKAAGLCHTDLEVIEGSLRYPMPIVLGHEAAGVVEEVGPEAKGVSVGDHVILSWNPHCGHCFYCDRDLPILCEAYLAHGPKAVAFDGESRIRRGDGSDLKQLMFLGAFGEYCVVPAEQAIVVPKELPFDRACLIGCGVMTGVGGALNVASIEYGGVAMVIGCGAVGLSAVQGCVLAGAGAIVAVDPNPVRRVLAQQLGATHAVEPGEAIDVARVLSQDRGADVVIEAAGVPAGFRLSLEAVRPGGQVVWLGKVGVQQEVAFRWGSLMQEKRITRSSYGGARPQQDFPMLARAYLEGRLKLDEMISARIPLEAINEGFAALKRGETVRSVVMFA